MARKPKLYQKLARRRGGVGTYVSLWLASDHVLQIESTMMTERYQRVWFRDVQGFFMRPSRESRLVTLVSLGFVVLFGMLILLGGTAAIVFSVLSGLAALVLVYGLFFARNCHFHVVTAVQKTEWANVARRRQGRKLLARLEPLIRESQRNEASAEPAAVDQATVAGSAPDAAVVA